VSPTANSLDDLRARIARFNEERDWAQYHNPRNLAMSVVVEAGELLELFLWSADDGPQPPVESRGPKVADEVADVLICLLALCDRMDIDPTQAVLQKLAKNAERYPVEKAKGRMEKYGEL
jgi:NTP pyrophosphatase (non-canonical NTP hydrolase)